MPYRLRSTAPPGLPARFALVAALLFGHAAAAQCPDPILGNPAISVGVKPVGLALGDLNGDGTTDVVILALLGSHSWGVRFYAGDGSGVRFFHQWDALLPDKPAAVALGDLNADDALDMVVSYETRHSFSVLLNLGGGAMAAPVGVSAGTIAPVFELADIDDDGAFDIVAPAIDLGALLVLRGRGDGTFDTARSWPAGIAPFRLALGDFNSDGLTDAVVTQTQPFQSPPWFSVLLNDGQGGFEPERQVPFSGNAHAIASGDLDGDGDIDLAIGSSASAPPYTAQFSVYENDGAAGFTVSHQAIPPSLPDRLLAADLNADGRAEIIGLNANFDASVFILRQDGAGAYQDLVPMRGGHQPDALASADLDGDGDMDIVIANPASRKFTVFINPGDGEFDREAWTGDIPDPDGLFVVRGDLDQAADVAAVFQGRRLYTSFDQFDEQPGVSMSVATAPGVLSPSVFTPVDHLIRSAAVLDLNGDGDGLDDAVVSGEWGYDRACFCYRDRYITTLRNVGGAFVIDQSILAPNSSFLLAAADLDGDGDDDVISRAADPLGLQTYRNDGSALTPWEFTPTGDQPITAMCVADIDADGDPDLVVAIPGTEDEASETYPEAWVVAMTHVGEGAFAERDRRRIHGLPHLMIACNLDADGVPDILVGTHSTESVFVVRGGRSRQKAPTRIDFTGQYLRALAAADLDEDGLDDLLCTANYDNLIVLRSLGNGAFGPPFTSDAGSGADSLIVGDFDADERIDAMTSNSFNQSLALFTNSCRDACFADLTGDHAVDASDLASLLAVFGSGDDLADLNQDGVVSTPDLGLLLLSFGRPCPE